MNNKRKMKRKTQRKKRITKKKMKRKTQRSKIIDPPFARTLSKGTQASPGCCAIDYQEERGEYHYQSYENVAILLESLIENDKSIQKDLYLFDKTSDAFLDYDLQSDILKPLSLYKNKFRKALRKGIDSKSLFIPIILNLSLDRYDNHANILVVNTLTKQIELFEPHGARTSSSELGGVASAYQKKKRALRKFFKEYLPKYSVINVVDAIKHSAFQTTEDPKGHSGFCVTWSILYAHYRFLNPRTPLRTLILYIHKKINERYILRYAKYIEMIAKGELH